MSDKIIEIPAIKLSNMTVSIEGTTPLLTNRFGERTMEAIEAKQQKKAKTAKEARDPDLEFREACHMVSEGVYGFPAGGIKKALVVAGGRFADEKMTHLRGILNPMGDLIPCPVQTGKTECCATCALCWQTERKIVFLAH